MQITANRVEQAAGIVREKLATLPADKVAQADAGLAIDFAEHFAYQQAQARAHASGKLSAAEAQTVYIALGEVGSDANGGWAAGTDTAMKYAISVLIAKILSDRLGMA
jgi:hypothetical protein